MRVIFVGKDRVVWKRMLLYVATLGITRRIWLYRVNKELDGHEALGLNHKTHVALLCLPVGGPTYLTAVTAKRCERMMQLGAPYGKWAAIYFPTWIPILGNLFFIGWTQQKLNQFWIEERKHPEHGVEVDVDLSDDPAFLVELGKAVRASYYAGSQYDRKKAIRRAKMQARLAGIQEIQEERKMVRAAGGSTPVLPFLRPKRPAIRTLKVTCGKCSTHFEALRDPLKETVLQCPKCERMEILPSLRDDELAGIDQAIVPTLAISCPECNCNFKVPRNLDGATKLVCPDCGTTGEVPAA